MNWTELTVKTPIPQYPKVMNYNFTSVKRYLDSFFDGSTNTLMVPLETTGRVKAARGEFVTSVVDNLIVKNQFTNLYENYTTSDKDFYYAYIGDEASTRAADPSVWPYESASYEWIDVNKPIYKIGNTTPIAFQNDNLSQVVRIMFNREVSTLNNFEVVLDPCLGSLLTIPAADASTRYLELICVKYDPSWGASWIPYKFGLLDASLSGGGGGGGTVGPGTIGRIAMFNTPNSVDDSSMYFSTGSLHVDGSIYERTKLLGVYDPCLNNSLAMPATVGGLTAGTTVASLRGKYIETILNDLLFPTVLASIGVVRSASLTGISTTTLEVGTPLTPTVLGTYVPGVITNGDGTTGPNLTGDASTFAFKLPNGTTNVTYDASANTCARTFSSYDVSFGSNIWQVTIVNQAGTGTYYDNKGNAVTNLDASRVAGSITANSLIVTGRRVAWRGYGVLGSAPISSGGVRALSSYSFLDANNAGTFDISIPATTQEVYFYIPTGKTVVVQYVESSYADVTASFVTSILSVNDAGGYTQIYDSWVSYIGSVGYPSTATYRVTIT